MKALSLVTVVGSLLFAVRVPAAAAPGKAGGGRGKATRLLVTATLPDVAPGRGLVLAIDPDTGAWEKVSDPGGSVAVASPDGKAVPSSPSWSGRAVRTNRDW